MSAPETARPTLEQLDAELQRRQRRRAYSSALRGTVWVLIVVAAIAVICANYFLSALRIQGTSMTPTLMAGDIVVALRTDDFDAGDIIAFYYNNKVLLKRAIGSAGDRVDIQSDGTVFVNGQALDEPYLTDKALGQTDIQLPYQVPEGRYFVLGDHRSDSLDSRSSQIGTVAEEQVVGRVLFRVWPLDRAGRID